ncbi:MAG: site-2 protease family protein [Phycisphaerae bacterium]|nr:site-2 protease family protein [Phycisphaerae bacterium]
MPRYSDNDTPDRYGSDGSWRSRRPRFDDPRTWSFRIARMARVDVRLHLLFILFVAVEILRSAFPASDDSSVRLSFLTTVGSMGVLFVIVLLHEFGHVFACRGTGGTADEILLWPLGGLASVDPPQRWGAHFITTAGGPLVNVAIILVTAPLLGIGTGEWMGMAFPNPFSPSEIWRLMGKPVLFTLFLFNYISLVLLLFNLLPIFPLDGGRLLQAILWSRLGYARATRIATRVGIVGAVGLAILAVVSKNWLLLGVAIFGGLSCIETAKRLEYGEAMLAADDAASIDPMQRVYAESLEASRRETEAAEAREAKERAKLAAAKADEEARRQHDEAEFNRILDKIHASGMQSLNASERRILERETARRRGGGSPS